MPSVRPRVRALILVVASAAMLLTTVVAAAPAAAAPAAERDEQQFTSELLRMLLGSFAEGDGETIEVASGSDRGARDAATPPVPCPARGPGDDVPRLVVAIFRCRLAEAGHGAADVDRIAAEAVVVAHCESLWDPDAVVFDGRYLDTPHPGTGFRYSAAGVFQFIRRTANDWIEGGYDHVTDARRNIDAAARLYLHNRSLGLGGWGDWACAAANDGFKVGSVLPGWPGGPAALPDWATEYLR